MPRIKPAWVTLPSRSTSFGTDHADFRTLGMIEQRLQPVRVDHFAVGRQQHQVLTLGLLAGGVVQRGCAQRLIGAQHA